MVDVPQEVQDLFNLVRTQEFQEAIIESFNSEYFIGNSDISISNQDIQRLVEINIDRIEQFYLERVNQDAEVDAVTANHAIEALKFLTGTAYNLGYGGEYLNEQEWGAIQGDIRGDYKVLSMELPEGLDSNLFTEPETNRILWDLEQGNKLMNSVYLLPDEYAILDNAGFSIFLTAQNDDYKPTLHNPRLLETMKIIEGYTSYAPYYNSHQELMDSYNNIMNNNPNEYDLELGQRSYDSAMEAANTGGDIRIEAETNYAWMMVQALFRANEPDITQDLEAESGEVFITIDDDFDPNTPAIDVELSETPRDIALQNRSNGRE